MASSSSSPRVLVFDLDGTLVDSAPDLADALDALLEEQGLAPHGLDTTRKLIGHGISNLVLRGLERRGVTLDPAALALQADRFRDIYARNLSRKTRPYDGVAAVLPQLRAEGWRMSVCTNKLERYARQILNDLGLLSFFDAVAGPDTFDAGKPDPRHLLRTVEALKGQVARTIMVGDSEVDVGTAKAAGIPIIAVTYGYTKTPLKDLAPEAIVNHFADVPPAIARLCRGWPA